MSELQWYRVASLLNLAVGAIDFEAYPAEYAKALAAYYAASDQWRKAKGLPPETH